MAGTEKMESLSMIPNLALDIDSKLQFEKRLQENKSILLEKFKNSKRDMINLSDEVLLVLKHAEHQKEHIHEWDGIKIVWNAIGFILFASLDLKTYAELLCTLNDSMQKIAVCRMAYIQIYETMQDIEKLLGKDFLGNLPKLNSGQFRDELCVKKKNLTLFKKKYADELKLIRVNVGAHRASDYVKFHQLLCDMEYTSAINLIMEYEKILDGIAEILQKIMKSSAKYVHSLYQ